MVANRLGHHVGNVHRTRYVQYGTEDKKRFQGITGDTLSGGSIDYRYYPDILSDCLINLRADCICHIRMGWLPIHPHAMAYTVRECLFMASGSRSIQYHACSNTVPDN